MRRVCTSIGAVWILSAIISIPPLIGMDTLHCYLLIYDALFLSFISYDI